MYAVCFFSRDLPFISNPWIFLGDCGKEKKPFESSRASARKRWHSRGFSDLFLKCKLQGTWVMKDDPC